MAKRILKSNGGIANIVDIDEEFEITMGFMNEVIEETIYSKIKMPLNLFRIAKTNFKKLLKLVFLFFFLLLKRLILNPITRNICALISTLIITSISILLIIMLIYWFAVDILSWTDYFYHMYKGENLNNSRVMYQFNSLTQDAHEKFIIHDP